MAYGESGYFITQAFRRTLNRAITNGIKEGTEISLPGLKNKIPEESGFTGQNTA